MKTFTLILTLITLFISTTLASATSLDHNINETDILKIKTAKMVFVNNTKGVYGGNNE